MNWTAYAPILAATLLLVLQGCSYLFFKKSVSHHRTAGSLTVLLASVGLALFVLLAAGPLVVSTEFKVVMTEGDLAVAGLGFVLSGLAVAAGLAWHLARSVRGLPSRLPLILGAAALGACLCLTRIRELSAEDGVRIFDRWCPFLVVWLAICASEVVTTLAGIRHRWIRFWCGTMLLTGIASYAVHRCHLRFRFADPWTFPLWTATLALGLLAVLSFGTFFALREFQGGLARRWSQAVAGVAGAAGFVGSISWALKGTQFRFLGVRPWLLCVAWLVALLLLGCIVLYRSWRKTRPSLPDLGQPGRGDDILALVVLLLLVVAFADLVHYGWADPVWDLAVLIFAWACLLELMGGAPLRTLVQGAGLENLESPLAAGTRKTWALSRGLARRLAAWIKVIFQAPTVPGVMLRVLTGLVLLVALSEIPNVGKTIVVPFSTPDLSETDRKQQGELGRMVSDRIVNTLAY